MKTLVTALVLLFLISSPVSAQEVSVAKVDFTEVDDLLKAVVMSLPANKELGERFKAQQAKEKEAQEKMQEAFMKGKKINPMEAASMMLGSDDKKKVEMLCEKHLLEIIEKTMGDKYQIVLKASYSSSLLYTKVAIDDVTDLIRQELLRQLPKE